MAEGIAHQVELAQIAKYEAETGFYKSRTRGFDLAADDFERDIKERDSSAPENRIYSFYAPIDTTTAFLCKATLGEWARQAEATGDERPFTIEICSPGGMVIPGFALIDYIHALQAKGHTINTIGYGWVASMGGVLLQSGSTRTIATNGYLMIHEISDQAVGKLAELQDHVRLSERLADRCANLLAEKSKLTAEEIKERWERRDWWLDSADCLEHGFVDNIL